jgi:hypothetical protein
MSSIQSYSTAVLRMAYESAIRAQARTAPDGRTDDALVTITLAASAAEGFVHDLAGFIAYLGAAHNVLRIGDTEQLVRVGAALETLESQRLQPQSMYLVAAALLRCDTIKKGKEPFQSLNDLFVLRNGVVHVKPVDPDSLSHLTKLVDALANRKIAKAALPRIPGAIWVDTWWTQIRTPEVANWAAEAARAGMLALAEALLAVGDFGNLLGGAADLLRSSDSVKALIPRS